MIGAYEDDTLIGLTGCWIASKFYCGKYLEIDNFVIDESKRGMGIGHRIIEHILNMAKQQHCDSIVLNAYIWNDEAHRFYDRYGFETIGKHRILKVVK